VESLKRAGLYRRLRRVDRREGPYIWIAGKKLISFASNDYLGLAGHRDVLAAVQRLLVRVGVGASSSRLLAGHHWIHEMLESRLADWMEVDSALVYPTGYMANLGLLTALIGPEDTVISDELNHASLIDACRLTRARVWVAPHRDVSWAEKKLRALRRAASSGWPRRRQVWILTESIFSMDGDVAPLGDWCRLAERYGARVIVDEAHALGVVGPEGRGVVATMGLPRHRLIVVGTLSKAFGAQGGVVFSDRDIRERLINTSRPFMFTTAIAPALAAATLAALTWVQRGDELRSRLWAAVHTVKRGLHALGWETRGSQSPILPMVVGDVRRTLRLAQRLFRAGFYAPAIRPPTVPPGTSRLRLSLTAHHEACHIYPFLEVLRRMDRGA